MFENDGQGIVDLLKDEWLRLLRQNELQRLSGEYAAMVFPGCWGALDCASWFWDSFPMAWAGKCQGKENKTNVRMEVICKFGLPGARNDVQIFNKS